MLQCPLVVVVCDGDNDICHQEVQVRLTLVGADLYNTRHIEAGLEDVGWRVEDGKHLCCNCSEGGLTDK